MMVCEASFQLYELGLYDSHEFINVYFNYENTLITPRNL